jgi:rSAM/selenodomain-associated transferase 1
MTAVVVISKAPLPGRCKTRLCPPCSPAEAARLGEAALRDTLAAVARAPARRRLLALDGEPGPWLRPGFELHAQRGAGLGERLGHALGLAGGPALVVGMDTPQLTPALLTAAGRRLLEPGVDAVLGPALDGGYWTLGLRRPDARVFDGVPMSTEHTGSLQLQRLRALGLRVAILPTLRDVDTMDDALCVAREAPGTRFAGAVRELSAAHAADHEQPVPVALGAARLESPHRRGRAGQVPR